MSTRNGPEEWRESVSPKTRSLYGKIRRMAIGVTSRALWQLIGHTGLDGNRETPQAEVFGGAGIYNRPGGRNAEVLVVFPGEGASAPCVVAIRDEQMRAALYAALAGGTLAIGETALASGVDGTVAALVHVKANSTVEIRTAAGVAVPLATLADVQAVRNALDGHSHLYTPGPGAPTPTTGNPAVPAPTGTTCIKSH